MFFHALTFVVARGSCWNPRPLGNDQELKQSEPKSRREMTEIRNSQNTMRTNGQPSEKLFQTELKIIRTHVR